MTAELIPSRDGTQIAVTETGNPDGPSVLLVHGWAQQMSCWGPLISRISRDFRIVSMDLRGHGASGKPADTEAYTKTELWADDVDSVVRRFDLKRPVLVGWSYGARVIAAYLAHHSADNVGGVVLAGGILAIGKSRPKWMIGASSPAANRDLYTDDLDRLLPATAAFVDDCTTEPLPRRLYAELVGANMLCPAHVRRALFAADVDFSDVYAALPCPGLVIHGTADRVVPAIVGERAAALMPHGTHLPYDGLGHAPFLEDPDRFARDLTDFINSLPQMEAA